MQMGNVSNGRLKLKRPIHLGLNLSRQSIRRSSQRTSFANIVLHLWNIQMFPPVKALPPWQGICWSAANINYRCKILRPSIPPIRRLTISSLLPIIVANLSWQTIVSRTESCVSSFLAIYHSLLSKMRSLSIFSKMHIPNCRLPQGDHLWTTSTPRPHSRKTKWSNEPQRVTRKSVLQWIFGRRVLILHS